MNFNATFVIASVSISSILLLAGCATTDSVSAKQTSTEEEYKPVDLHRFGPRYSDFSPVFVDQCRNRAESGDAEGVFLYGYALFHGLGGKGWSTVEEANKGFDLIKQAATLTNSLAQAELGTLLLRGEKCPKDEVSGKEWLRQSMENGNAKAAYTLSLCTQDNSEKNRLLKLAAEMGYPEAQETMALYLEYGKNGVVQNMAESQKLYSMAAISVKKAAEQGDVECQLQLAREYGSLLKYAEAGVAGDYRARERAVEKWRLCAISSLRKLADRGDCKACWLIGGLLERKKSPEELEEAAKMYRKAAEQGFAPAEYALGMCYLYGKGVDMDLDIAREWLSKASEKGHPLAAGKLPLTVPFASDFSITKKVWESVAEEATRLTTAPRMSGADSVAGEGLLEAFGTRYMPNAYEYYEKMRETAKEREAVLQENFPKGRSSDNTGGSLYDKTAKAVAKAVSEMDRRHDELCQYYLLRKAGMMTDEELSVVDSSKISILLPRIEPIQLAPGGEFSIPEEERTFAAKYMPETIAGFDRLASILDEGNKEYAELYRDAQKMDAVRADAVLMPLRLRLAEVRSWLSKLNTFKQEKLMHAMGEKTSDQLSELDQRNAVEIQGFEKSLPVRRYALTWQKANWKEVCLAGAYQDAPLAALPATMVTIEGMPYKWRGVDMPKKYTMCKYEVTFKLWRQIMGDNPTLCAEYAENWASDLPVVFVSWNDCQTFMSKLNARMGRTAIPYRLPTSEEWMFACHAGATNGYTRLMNGRDIRSYTLGDVAWRLNTSVVYDPTTLGIHPFGLKLPNAFGLYDIIGNAYEWVQTLSENDNATRNGSACIGGVIGGKFYEGGGWSGSKETEGVGFETVYPSSAFQTVGFRLAK